MLTLQNTGADGSMLREICEAPGRRRMPAVLALLAAAHVAGGAMPLSGPGHGSRRQVAIGLRAAAARTFAATRRWSQGASQGMHANAAGQGAAEEGGGGAPDTMMGWKDEGEADQALVAAMLGLRNHGDENKTLTPLAFAGDDVPAGAGFREIARYAVDDAGAGGVGVGAAGAPDAQYVLKELADGEIRTPDTDARAYKHVRLSNGMHAMLVSDPEAHSAAAALCVSAGQLDDPECVQGLAHFCEHMLFLGTEKYPEESNFDQFCASAAGYSNAWTSLDHTMYHFIVANKKLQEALDRFASFFSCPLFSASGTEREMKAVDSEHNKNLQDDDRREYQLMRCTAAATHPFSRFGAGNLHTLQDIPKAADPPVNIRDELLAFHAREYVAGRMRLAVIGMEPLEVLERWVNDSFHAVPEETEASKKATPRKWIDFSPFDAGWKRAYLLAPVSERRQLALFFPAPPTQSEFHAKPAHFLSHLVGHEGPGSLLSVLKALGWATELSAGPGTTLPSESLYSITVRLTEEGVRAWEGVLMLVFRYLHLVRASNDQERERLWWEVRTMSLQNFRFKVKEREDVQSEMMALSMHYYPPAEVLGAQELLYLDWSQEVSDKLDRLLDKHVVSSNMRLHLTCPEDEVPPSFLATEEEADKKEEAAEEEGRNKKEKGVEVGEDGCKGEGVEAGDRGGRGGGGECVKASAGWEVDVWLGTRYRVRNIPQRIRKRAGDWFSHLTGEWLKWSCLSGVDKDLVLNPKP